MSLKRISVSIEMSIIMIIALPSILRMPGYASIILWTNESLSGARRLYRSFGFEVVEFRKQVLSGQELTEEKWKLMLELGRE